MRRYIPIDTDNMPDPFEIEIDGAKYFFRIDYNQVADYFTATIANANKVLVTSEPLLLNNLLGQDIPDPDLPANDLRVMDESGQALDAGLVYMGSGQVKLYIDEVDPNGSETDDPGATPFGYDPDGDDDDTDMEGAVVI